MNDANDIDEACRPFEEDLSAWIDGEVAPARLAPLRAHVESCGACTRRVAALRAIDVALRSANEAEAVDDDMRLAEVRRNVDASLHGAAVERPIAQRAPRRPRRWLAPLAAGSIAAAAAALLLLVRPAPTQEPAPARERTIAASEPAASPIAPALAPETAIAAQKRTEAFAGSGASALPDAETDTAAPPAAKSELELESARELEMIERLAALSEAERSKLARNLARWQTLSVEEREQVRTRLRSPIAR